MKKVLAIGLVLAMLTVVSFDARIHFSKQLLLAKRSVNSAQRHWNLFYTQKYVYQDGIFRYLRDFDEIRQIIVPNQLLLSDKASSYYAATELPVYVPNIHTHHKRAALPQWKTFLDSRHACHIDQPSRLIKFSKFVYNWRSSSKAKELPFTYILVNKDQINANLQLDCLSQTRRAMVAGLKMLASIEYDGDYLRLYKLDYDAISDLHAEIQ